MNSVNLKLSLPRKSMKYLLLQRTNYQKIQGSGLVKLLSRVLPIDEPISLRKKQIEGILRKRTIESDFTKEMALEFKELVPHLPQKVNSILDIGCGLASIDVFLYKHFINSKPNLFLLDKSCIDASIHYNFEDQGAFYNSLELARDILIKNDVDASHISLYDISQTKRLAENKVDLILSLISWGFHYPIETYIELVNQMTHDRSVVITDIRKDTNGHEVMMRKFQHAKIISSTDAKDRILYSKLPLV